MKERASNIELLRGILMFMIVCVHLTGNGVLNAENPIAVGNTNWIYANIIDGLFYCCVNTFILITGYFGLRASFKKYMALDIPVIIYSLLAVAFFGNYALKSVMGGVFPTLSNSYWFLTQYFLLFLLSPFLNAYIAAIDRKQFIETIVLATLIVVIIPTFLRYDIAGSRGMNFISFALLYLIGRYFSIYKIKSKISTAIITYVSTSALIIALTLILGYQYGINKGWQSPFFAYNCILVYIQSISFFFMFKSLNIKSKFINFLSPSFFYIYIIHENPIVHAYLYSWLRCEDYYYSNYFLVHTLGSSLIIFVGCLLIDIILRRVLLKKPIGFIVENFDILYKKLTNKII